MREIRARIAQRHGIDLSTAQIRELAARRLDAVLDLRTVSPALIDQLRRGAGTVVEIPDAGSLPSYAFDDGTLYDGHTGLLGIIRRVLHPILKLFFNPAALTRTLGTQARLNAALQARETDRDRRQTEWNALHYEIVQRLVTEVSRVSIEIQSLSMRVESLAAKVDFNERRVRSFESTPPPRTGPRAADPGGAVSPVALAEGPTPDAASIDSTGEGARRKRRRRRGRRGSGTGEPFEGASNSEAGQRVDAPATLTEPSSQSTDDRPTPAGEHRFEPQDERRAPSSEESPSTSAQPAEHPVQPTPAMDEPTAAAPIDRPDAGPPDR